MKIAYILPISWGGIPQYTAELANAVSKYADVVVLKPKDSNDELFSEDVTIINTFEPLYFSRESDMTLFSLKNFKNLFSFGRVRIIDKVKPDVIHFPNPYPHTTVFTYLYRLDKKYSTVYTMHYASDSYIALPAVRGFIRAFIASISRLSLGLTKVDKMIVHTQKDKNALVTRGIRREKIIVIPHGAFTFFENYDKNESENENNCILFFGYIEKNKGVEYLIKAVPIIAKRMPDVRVIIAGEGNLSPYSKYIKDVTKFEIHNEFISNEVVSQLFQRAKIVVLPYIFHKGHSGVINVARSFGKPVIVTNVGDLPNMIENEKDGLIVPPRDSEALAEAVIKLLKDDDLRKQMGENALKKAEELSWGNIAKKHIKVYEGVIADEK